MQNGLERGVLHSVWLASLSPSCPAWLSITAALPVFPEHIFHQQSSCQTSVSQHWIRGRKQRLPLVTLKLSLSVGLSLAVVGGIEEVETTRSRRDSKSMSVCGTIDRTADRRSKGVINLLFKSKVRLSGVPRQAFYRQVSALNSLKELKSFFWVFFDDLNIMISITILISTELQNRGYEVQWSIQRQLKSFLKCLKMFFFLCSLPFKRNKLGIYQSMRKTNLSLT